ncbi:MAG TPA: DUF1360 domain-containing protein [Mycobacteriales bacterium]|nr:DUF1360 domain-containing protein [Mycobacteriales bacterium]
MDIETPSDISRRYAPQDDRPLGSFLGLMAAYGTAVAGAAALVRRHGVRLPERIELGDLALVAVATHKVARLLAKDPITSPLRAPFTRFAGTSGDAELKEEVRGTGPRKAVGELVTCPFCMSQWVATGFVFGLVVQPRLTRAVASVFSIVAASDYLQHAYAQVQDL